MGMEAFDASMTGWAVLGVLPALLWTWLYVRRATRRRERQFVRRGSVLVWALAAVYLAMLRIFPEAYAILVLAIHAAVLTLAVTLIEWRRTQLRERDWTTSYLFARKAPMSR